MKRRLASALLFTAAILAFAGASAPGANFPDNEKTRALGPLAGRMDARLIPAVSDLRAATKSLRQATDDFKRDNSGAYMQSTGADRFIVRLNAEATDELVAAVTKLRVPILNVAPQWKAITVDATIDDVSRLEALTGIDFMVLESGAASGRTVKQSGTVGNKADETMKANLLRSTFSLTGTGQKVGVLSDSCNRTAAVGAGNVTGTAPNAFVSNTNPQSSGNLPASYQVVDFGPTSGVSDEGGGMMELVYDVAPGAGLAFASAFNGQAAFGTAIGQLRTAAGCTVICDDIFYYEEPFFQDGPIAQAVDATVDAGVPYFALAGNHYDVGIGGVYNDINSSTDDTASTPSGNDFHNWGIGGATPAFLPVTIGNGTTLYAVLQWDQPWSSFSLGAGSAADLDLLIYATPAAGGALLASSARAQGTSTSARAGDPTEYAYYTNGTGSSRTVYLAIEHYDGLRGNNFRIVCLPNGATYTFPSGGAGGSTVYGHMAAAKAITVGAIFYGDIETNGTVGPDTTNINPESFTSEGGLNATGVPIYYTTSGVLIPGGPERRNKPDIAAPDGTNTSFFGSDSSFDADTFPNFFGTSAATPNAAAVGALLRQLKPSMTPLELKNLLKNTAIDVVSTTPLCAVGTDDRTGAGRIDALAAGNLLVATPTPTVSPTPSISPTASLTPSPTASLTATPSPTASLTPVPTASLTASPTASLTPSPTATSAPTASATASATPSPTASLTPSPTASLTPVPTASLTASPTASLTATPSPTASLTPVPTASLTASPTASPGPSPTASATPTASPAASATPSASASPTPSASPSTTPTESPTPTIGTTDVLQALLGLRDSPDGQELPLGDENNDGFWDAADLIAPVSSR